MKEDSKHKLIEEKVQKALDYVEQDEGYQPNPFIYTRIKQQLANQQEHRSNSISSIAVLWKPVLAVLLIALNVYVLLDTQSISTTSSDALAKEYGWTAETPASNYLNYK